MGNSKDLIAAVNQRADRPCGSPDEPSPPKNAAQKGDRSHYLRKIVPVPFFPRLATAILGAELALSALGQKII
jgi:hypothetical protein